MPSEVRLQEFVEWCDQHLIGDEKGQAQIFLDRLFQAFGLGGVFDAGAESRVPHPQGQGGRRRHRLRRSGLETRRARRDEEAR
jgi:hypothetical protein